MILKKIYYIISTFFVLFFFLGGLQEHFFMGREPREGSVSGCSADRKDNGNGI